MKRIALLTMNMTMKRIVTTMALVLGFALTGMAQTAREVLDKCATKVSAPEGVQAQFSMNSAQYGQASGTIAVKGRKFCASTDVTSMWFDGTTLWTYVKQNDEVNVTTPSEQQLQVLNPYNFINLYKDGFNTTMTTTAQCYVVHLTAADPQRKVQELFINIDKSTYAPTEVKLLQKQKWTTFTIGQLKTTALSDATFRFNSADFPSAEVIDLR